MCHPVRTENSSGVRPFHPRQSNTRIKLPHLSAPIGHWFDPIREDAVGEHPAAISRRADREELRRV